MEWVNISKLFSQTRLSQTFQSFSDKVQSSPTLVLHSRHGPQCFGPANTRTHSCTHLLAENPPKLYIFHPPSLKSGYRAQSAYGPLDVLKMGKKNFFMAL